MLTTWISRSERVKEGGRVPIAGKLGGWQNCLRKQCFQEWSPWESRKQMGGVGPLALSGLQQVGKRMWGIPVFLLLAPHSSQCPGHWSVTLGVGPVKTVREV